VQIDVVQEFALGFNSVTNECDFWGREFALTTDVLKAAFCLPSGGSVFKECPNKTHLRKYVKSSIAPVFKLFQKLVTGKPDDANVNQTFWNSDFELMHLSGKRSLESPDWAALVPVSLTKELNELKSQLERSEYERRKSPLRRNNCGIALTHLRMHFIRLSFY
jgi:hypothetical protein